MTNLTDYEAPQHVQEERKKVANLWRIMGLVVALPSLASAIAMFAYPGEHDGIKWYFVITTVLGFAAVALAGVFGRRVKS